MILDFPRRPEMPQPRSPMPVEPLVFEDPHWIVVLKRTLNWAVAFVILGLFPVCLGVWMGWL